MNKLMQYLAVLAATVLLVVAAGAPAAAQTADGITPAIETVCDSEVGETFGLCNAYCEAMDCDSATPSASDKACSKVATRYEELTGTLPPCENQPPRPTATCPCESFATADFASPGLLFVSVFDGLEGPCFDSPSTCLNGFTCQIDQDLGFPGFIVTLTDPNLGFRFDWQARTSSDSCRAVLDENQTTSIFIDLKTLNEFPPPLGWWVDLDVFTPEENAACQAHLNGMVDRVVGSIESFINSSPHVSGFVCTDVTGGT